MPTEEEKKEVEEILKKKEEKQPWWQSLSPTVLAGAILIGFFLLRKVMEDTKNKNNFLFWIIAIAVILYILSKSPRPKEEALVTPKEAELLVERECERKKRWGQFGPMSKYIIGPVSYLQRKDGGGMYYDIAVEVTDPYDKPKYFTAVVMAKGEARAFTTLVEGIGSLTGREKVSERTIIPQWMIDAKREPMMEKFFFRGK